MRRFFIRMTAALCACLAITSCNNDDDNGYNPFDEVKTGKLLPSSITIEKNTDLISRSESWTDIVRDSLDRITQYNYKYTTRGTYFESEERKCKIFYHTNHLSQEMITTNTEVTYTKIDISNGISDSYRQNVFETITLNSSGYISDIASTIFEFNGVSTDPVMKTSARSFTYNGDYCVASEYTDETCKTTYTYNWNAYQLVGTTVLKENYIDGSIETTSHEYKYKNDEIYKYSGTHPLPFVQKGFPSIFASMGYIGRFTPYVLSEENQSGHVNFNNESTSTPDLQNKYYLEGDADTKLKYTALSNIYKTFDIIFSK